MAITVGPAGTPNSVTINLDAVFSTSLANYSRTLVDNITKSNVFFFELSKRNLWKSTDGGMYLVEPLLYGLATPQAYSGYDVLSTEPTDGITQAVFDWAQAAVPCSISGLEEIRNRQKIVDLIDAKIQQSEMGIKEWFAKAFLQGSLLSGGSSLSLPYVEPTNGATFIQPLFKLISYSATPGGTDGAQPTNANVVGGLDQAVHTWWRNWCIPSAATTYMGMLLEFDKMYDFVSRGPGGEPNLIWTDETTKRLLNAAYYQAYRTQMTTDGNYPFDNVKFRKAHVVCDEFMPDVHSGTPSTGTFGTAVFINTSFMKMRYDSQTNFKAGSFKTPINQDAQVKHILWAGNSIVNNRRKLGVIGKIPRTLVP